MVLYKTLIVLALLTTARGHSRLSSPAIEKQQYCKAGAGCGPCDRPVRERFSAANPAATWSRGQRVQYAYEKNNHDEGFVRISIIPMNYRLDLAAHERFAFKYHCFAGPQKRCPSQAVCGSDKGNMHYYHDFTVPRSIPDGLYHFSWAWFGGGGKSNRRGYSTLYSCSVVRIAGGGAVQASSPVSFEASRAPSNQPGQCATHALRYSDCDQSSAVQEQGSRRYFCNNKPEFQAIPPQFSGEGESRTLSITSQMFGSSGGAPTSSTTGNAGGAETTGNARGQESTGNVRDAETTSTTSGGGTTGAPDTGNSGGRRRNRRRGNRNRGGFRNRRRFRSF